MDLCVACNQPLVFQAEGSDDEQDVGMGGSSSAAQASKTVPDDVHLNCGCHFHWQCLLDSYTVTQCPNCSKDLTTSAEIGSMQILCNLNNEGGLQENLDILPILSEEGYLKAYPEERKARAFLELCREGDVEVIVNILQPDDDDEDEDAMTGANNIDILRYQDTLADNQSGLHYAILGGSQEVAWLLLLLASNLEPQSFPSQVLQEAQAAGLSREDQSGKSDIRGIKDAQGRTAEQLAAEKGGVWSSWLGTRRLTV